MVGGLTAGSVIPGTVIDGQVISGGVLPGAVTSEGVLFDSSTIDGSVISSGPPAGTCSHCGKSHTDLKPVPGPAVTPVPQAVPPSTEALPGQVNQGTLKPQTPPASVDHPIQATQEPAPEQASPETGNPPAPATTNEPQPMPGVFLETPIDLPDSKPDPHPPAGAARARITPSSWRNSNPVQKQNDLQTPQGQNEPTTLMIPTIPDNTETRNVHWLPQQSQ